MTTDWRASRIAKNEASFRDINERLDQGLRQVRHAPQLQRFVCECGDRECEALVLLTFEEYEEVRSDSRHFAAVPGHVFPETERVVRGNTRYEVLEKFGEAVSYADATDQREPGPGGRRDS